MTERTITGRKSDGRLPVTQEGKIDLRAVVNAGVAALAAAAKGEVLGNDLESNRARESKLRGDRLEMVNAQLAATLIPAEEVEAVVGAAFDAVRVKLIAVPPAISARLAMTSDANEALGILTESIHDALADLAQGEVVAAVKDRARAHAAGDPADDGAAGVEAEAAA